MDKEGRFLLGVALAVGLVTSAWVVSRAAVRVKGDDVIQVTGSAKRRIRSDLIIWNARVSARGSDMKSAYQSLAASMPKVLAWLDKAGVDKKQLKVSSVTTQQLHPHDKDGRTLEDQVTGYVMIQSVEIKSSDVDKIEQISREATQLIDQGVALDSDAPEYHYTKLGDLKIQMLAEAAKDTAVRAAQIAQSTGARIGPLRSARMGVLQINPADSTETSNEGNNDVTALEKDVIAVVSSVFALE